MAAQQGCVCGSSQPQYGSYGTSGRFEVVSLDCLETTCASAATIAAPLSTDVSLDLAYVTDATSALADAAAAAAACATVLGPLVQVRARVCVIAIVSSSHTRAHFRRAMSHSGTK
jgi:hypothetical protein